MSEIWPLRFREIGERLFFADDAGGYFLSDPAFLERYAMGLLDQTDRDFLAENGHAFERENDLASTAFGFRWAARQHVRRPLAYLILVPTLRCNLSCSYCQVSRAPERAVGYDWGESNLEDVLSFIDRLDTDQMKIEFQGGEPLLRLDLLDRVRSFCRQRFSQSQFVVCTNLQHLGPAELAFLDCPDTFVSTSIDGEPSDHDKRRTQSPELAEEFFANLETLVARCGTSRLSALPTIDVDDPPDFDGLISTYERLGLRSIYFRPINYQGFARRALGTGDQSAKWNNLYNAFLDHLIERNFETGDVFEEFYFALCLRRLLRAGEDGHVDLRNPSLLGVDYLVVDYDGQLYPSDEARMLSRVRHIDLSIGTVASGVDSDRVAAMNISASNNFDPDCIHCPYQPFCGSDVIDDVSRYGRIDLPRGDTWFCKRQLSIFDRIVALIYGGDEKARFSLRHWAGLASWPDALAPRHDPAPH